MGRGKIEIKRIENSSNRQVTYSKRRSGIIKKAKEITVLCDAQVSLVIFASSGRMHEYCSPSTTVVDLLDKYHKQSGKRLWDAKHENLSNEIDRIKKENESMQIELRHLKGQDISSLPHKELMAIEEALDTGLAAVRKKQMEFHSMLEQNEKILDEEFKHLQFVLQQQEMAMEESAMEMENAYHQQRVRDYNSQVPFAFRVQPIQPNLQERM
ncbi:agamous-like MADS-box protein MADS9 [Populus alba x Populus x berolinensis]|uniref:Agamous-like MADS-box protein MADS9 n=1 Tax=Populus alba x Populus x berolinensis TaxID=444605 RepID=A0AAD6RD51_9ROSI|nr:agamous-like MADS-box protein MADS9 [Populus alba]KAJ6954276.1 agamous-like MADS-box protein MADS9 [Populus alba x Populus x berolinensis]KAJ7006574.1 agamous-like MADS-box protein MADS9 [Populus alba x Populus x berolinensis]